MASAEQLEVMQSYNSQETPKFFGRRSQKFRDVVRMMSRNLRAYHPIILQLAEAWNLVSLILDSGNFRQGRDFRLNLRFSSTPRFSP